MVATYLIGFFFAFSGLPRYFERLHGERFPRIFGSLAVVGLVLCFLLALFVDWCVAVNFPGGIPEARTAPFAFIDFVRVDTGPKVGTIEECLALAETILSALFLLSVPKKRFSKELYVLCCAAFVIYAVVGVFAPYVGSSDVYAYIAQAVSQPSGYDPGRFLDPGRYWPAFVVWGNPTLPSPYGPLFLWMTKKLTDVAGGVWGSVVGLRVFGVVSLGLCVWSLQRLKIDVRVCWLVLLCPELWRLYVLDAHNDLLPAACVLAAAAVVSRMPIIAVLLVAAATAIKLPFALFGMSAFRSVSKIEFRFLLPLVGAAIGILASFVVAGDLYPEAIFNTSRAYVHQKSHLESALHVVLALTALLGIVLLVVDRRVRFGASFCVVTLSQFASEQYVAWGLPFVALSSSMLAAYICLLPLAGFLLSFTYAVTPFSFAVRLILICVLAGFCASRLMRIARDHSFF